MWLVILAGFPALLAAVLSFVAVLLSQKNAEKLSAVHIQINSRMDQLLAATASAANSEGNIEGRKQAHLEKRTESEL